MNFLSCKSSKGNSKSAFVIGWPINHSRSPVIHNYWLNRYKINCSYQKIAVKPNDIADFINSMRTGSFIGGNVTLPYKEAVFALVDVHDESADILQATNTLWFEDSKIYAGNTDSYGFLCNLDEKSPGWDQMKKAVVLGAGGASRAVIYGLICRGFNDIRIVNRTEKRAKVLADHFKNGTSSHGLFAINELISDVDLLVNTIPYGIGENKKICMDFNLIPAHAVVTDIVYIPLLTPLLADAKKYGLATVDGLGMLLHQAVPGFKKWFGLTPVVDHILRNKVINNINTAI